MLTLLPILSQGDLPKSGSRTPAKVPPGAIVDTHGGLPIGMAGGLATLFAALLKGQQNPQTSEAKGLAPLLQALLQGSTEPLESVDGQPTTTMPALRMGQYVDAPYTAEELDKLVPLPAFMTEVKKTEAEAETEKEEPTKKERRQSGSGYKKRKRIMEARKRADAERRARSNNRKRVARDTRNARNERDVRSRVRDIKRGRRGRGL